MVLIHDAVERVISCGPGGIVEERNEGYELFEHFEQIHVRVHTTIEGGRERTLRFLLTHEEMPTFCRMYGVYREAEMERERAIMKHIRAALFGKESLNEYYRQNRVDLAALKLTMPMFVEVLAEYQRSHRSSQPATSYLMAS